MPTAWLSCRAMRDSWRQIVLAAAALCVCACGQQTTQAPQAASGCALSATQHVTWSNAETPDTITTRADGPACARAVVSFTVLDARGNSVWRFNSTYHDMTVGGAAPADAPAVSPEQAARFLASWTNVTVQTSDRLPEWRDGAAEIVGQGGLRYSTALTRERYEAMRHGNLRMICYAAAVDTTQCLVIDPTSNSPTMIAAYGP